MHRVAVDPLDLTKIHLLLSLGDNDSSPLANASIWQFGTNNTAQIHTMECSSKSTSITNRSFETTTLITRSTNQYISIFCINKHMMKGYEI